MRIHDALGRADHTDILVAPDNNEWIIAPNAVTDEKFRDSAALSVIGRATNSVGDPADIIAATAGELLRRYANAVTFGSTMEGNTTWDDNAEVRLGTGGDLRLFHDGISSSVINDTGNLLIRAAGNILLSPVGGVTDAIEIGNYGMPLGYNYIDLKSARIDDTTGDVAINTDCHVLGDFVADNIIRTGNGLVGTPSYTFVNDTDTGLYSEGDNRLRITAGGVLAMAIGDTFILPLVPFLANDGSAAAPIYAFSNDPDCGLYRAGTNAVGISAAGVLRVTADSNGLTLRAGDQFFTGDGAASSPVITFTSDTNTGIYRVGADQLGLATAGALGLVVDATQRVYGTALHNNASSPTGTTNQYVASGTYTPTLTAVANATSLSADPFQWIRVGNVVTVSGSILAAATSAGPSMQVGITLPIASAFTASYQCAGVAKANTANGPSGAVFADAANDRANMQIQDTPTTSTLAYHMTFTYLIL